MKNYTNQCHNKNSHKTLQSAIRVKSKMKAKYGVGFWAYECKFCQEFHVGKVNPGKTTHIKISSNIKDKDRPLRVKPKFSQGQTVMFNGEIRKIKECHNMTWTSDNYDSYTYILERGDGGNVPEEQLKEQK